MANLIYTLSTRVNNGTAEVMVRFSGGRGYDQRAHTRVRVPIHLWDADGHCLIVNKRYVSEDTILASNLQARLDSIEQLVLARFVQEKHLFSPGWLQRVVDECIPRASTIVPVRIDKACVEYSTANGLEPGTQRQYLALARILARYCEQIRPIFMSSISTDDLDDLYRFFRRWNGEDISHNTIAAKMRKIRAICYWAQRKGMMEKCPFADGYTIKQEVYGTPTTLSMQEVEHIYRAPMPSAHLSTQRDIFVFQCFVGQRISDLRRMTASNLIATSSGLVLQYMQKKTRKQTPRVTEVPLSKIAVEIIERYAGRLDGKILPFIAEQNYNYAIKDILREAGITRLVPILDTKTFSEELKPICEIASSHLARRTFTSNIFEITQDERLTISLTGHAEGSRALSRYIKITDKTKRSVIDRLEGK